MWEKIIEFLKTYGVKVLIALAILVVGFILIRIVMLIMKKVMEKTKLEKATAKFLRNCVKFALWMLLFMAIAQYVGIPVTGFIALISAAGLALSLALQGSLSNLANGVVIISTKPFKEGDYVSIGNIEGTVCEIKMMHTILTTVDNKEISIPNKTVVESEITNYNRHKTRKVIIEFPVSYDTDIEQAKVLLNKIMINNDKVLLEPAPVVRLKRFEDSSIVLRTDCWCATENYWDLYYDLMDTTFNEFKRENINIPFNQMEVRLRDDVVTMPFNKAPIKMRSEDATYKIVETNDEEFVLFKNPLKLSTKKSSSKKSKTKKSKSKNDISSNDSKAQKKQDEELPVEDENKPDNNDNN